MKQKINYNQKYSDWKEELGYYRSGGSRKKAWEKSRIKEEKRRFNSLLCKNVKLYIRETNKIIRELDSIIAKVDKARKENEKEEQ